MIGNNFCVIAGIDGSGKSTLLKELKLKYPDLVTTGWNDFNKVIDKTYDKETNVSNSEFIKNLSSFTRSALFLYIYGLQLDKIINPNIYAGKHVIADTYWYKFMAKMELTNGGDEYLLKRCSSLLKPSKIIFLDTDPVIAFKRKSYFNFYETNGDTNNFINFQRSIREKILEYISGIHNILTLDGDESLSKNIINASRFIFET